MSTPVEDIKSRLDVVEIIQGYVRLQKSGSNYRTNCPFHGEKTPSFFVSPVRQIWHCFGCGRGGDLFKFVMDIEGLDFPEALKMLAQKAGVVLKRENPVLSSEKNRLYDICEQAALLFEKNLLLNTAVKNYLKKREVTEASVREFRLGFAPDSWDFLLRALHAKGFKKEDIAKAGLAIKSDKNSSWYDRFRNRVIFPISDANGRVIGFGGRVFPAEKKSAGDQREEAKYINTPQTPIYDKSSVLYGLDRAKQEIRTKNNVVLVEGYMDCLMSHQAGLKNAVAVSGTALTPVQLKNLRRLCDTIVASFDADSAGESATKRSLSLAAQFEFERKIAAIPTGKDPADTVAENPDLWLKSVASAKPVVEFFFEKAFKEKNPNHVNGKKEIMAILMPFLAELASEVEKSHWVADMARRLEVREESVWKDLKRFKPNEVWQPAANLAESSVSPAATRRDLLEERLLSVLPFIKQEVKEKELAGRHIVFTSSVNKEIFDLLKNIHTSAVVPENLQEKMETLRFKGEVIAETIADLEGEFLICQRELEKMSIKEELLALGRQIQEKEKAGQPQEMATLLHNFNQLSQKLKTII